MPTLFERIIKGEIPGTFVYRDAEVVAIRDIAPQAPTHILIIPVRPIPALSGVSDGDQALLGRMLLLARDLARQEGLTAGGYRLVINEGADGGQTVPHLHLHLLGGRAFSWPAG